MERNNNKTITVLTDEEAIKIINRYIDKRIKSSKGRLEGIDDSGNYFFEISNELPKFTDLEVASLMIVDCFKQLKSNIEAAKEYVRLHKKNYDVDGSFDSNLNEFQPTAKPDELIAILDRGTEEK